MSNAFLQNTISDTQIEIRFPKAKRGLLARLTGGSDVPKSFHNLPEDDHGILLAIGDLRAWADTHEGEVEIETDHIRASHDAVASLNAASANALGLPDDIHLTLKTDVVGTLGKPDFRLNCEWADMGRRVNPRRQGSIIYTADGPRRVPLWMKHALDLAEGFDPHQSVEDHWRALAEFRHALEPDEAPEATPENQSVSNLAMTAFLRGLEVRIANQFSISPDEGLGQFEVVPYSSRSLEDRKVGANEISEGDAELTGEALAVFQYRLRQRGACPAFQLGQNSYLVIDSASQPVLEEMARVQKADREERKAFIQNPRAYVTNAVNKHLKDSGAFDGLSATDQEELSEKVSGTSFIESREYSERVTGTKVYERPAPSFDGSGTSWLPEVFSRKIAEAIEQMPTPDLEAVRDHIRASLEAGGDTPALIDGELVKVSPERLTAIEAVLKAREDTQGEDDQDEAGQEGERQTGPIILDTLDNSEDLAWHAKLAPRTPGIPFDVPDTILTPLRQHQTESFGWATKAWSAGLPGILNADEQGLGKTLQTIAFLNWLQSHMKDQTAKNRGPILVVAPTSLLRTWEAEVDTHVAPRKFGRLIRLYGSSLAGHKQAGARGTETGTGLPLLDLEWLEEAFEEDRAHRYWFLTTYTTLANYQHSLGTIPFSALVMDEIQNIKNKDTIASKAAEAMNADFRIGLTGTPIENSTTDLWTIIDRLSPGALGSAKDFKKSYGTPNDDNMAELHAHVFEPQAGCPPIGLRRLKDDVAKDLPQKSRLMHPRIMPQMQAKVYDEAREKMASGGPGAALKMLHHIRSVSVHPALHHVGEPNKFVAMSARLSAVMDILERLNRRNERVLVFIEHREMQFRFAELVRHYFGLNSVDVINGATPIPRRQAIVERFQKHQQGAGPFDLLILGPKAAGTGLTLTSANHVIHLSRWWNPAVEEQCNDRVHRIGQTQPVTVHVPLAIHPGYQAQSFDCLLQSLMQRKRRMASQALWPMGDTTGDLAGLQQGLDGSLVTSGQTSSKTADAIIRDTMAALFMRDGMPQIEPDESGAFSVY